MSVGSAKRYRVKAIQTSKHCNIVCMYTAFTIIDSNPNKSFQDGVEVQNAGVPTILSMVTCTIKQVPIEHELKWLRKDT